MRLSGFKGEEFVLQYEAGEVTFELAVLDGVEELVVTAPTGPQFGSTGRYVRSESTDGFRWSALGNGHDVEEPQLSIFRTEWQRLHSA